MSAEIKQLPDFRKAASDRIKEQLFKDLETLLVNHDGRLSGFAIVFWDAEASTSCMMNNSGPALLPLRIIPALVEESVRACLVMNDIERVLGAKTDGAS
jgi:hypothetical protein